MALPYRVWMNADRTILVRLWDSGVIEMAFRPDSSALWGPPVTLKEDKS